MADQAAKMPHCPLCLSLCQEAPAKDTSTAAGACRPFMSQVAQGVAALLHMPKMQQQPFIRSALQALGTFKWLEGLTPGSMHHWRCMAVVCACNSLQLMNRPWSQAQTVILVNCGAQADLWDILQLQPGSGTRIIVADSHRCAILPKPK
jgi:hypothetical protein